MECLCLLSHCLLILCPVIERAAVCNKCVISARSDFFLFETDFKENVNVTERGLINDITANCYNHHNIIFNETP